MKKKKPSRGVTIAVNVLLIAGICFLGWKIADHLIQSRQSADFSDKLMQQVMVSAPKTDGQPETEEAGEITAPQTSASEPEQEAENPQVQEVSAKQSAEAKAAEQQTESLTDMQSTSRSEKLTASIPEQQTTETKAAVQQNASAAAQMKASEQKQEPAEAKPEEQQKVSEPEQQKAETKDVEQLTASVAETSSEKTEEKSTSESARQPEQNVTDGKQAAEAKTEEASTLESIGQPEGHETAAQRPESITETPAEAIGTTEEAGTTEQNQDQSEKEKTSESPADTTTEQAEQLPANTPTEGIDSAEPELNEEEYVVEDDEPVFTVQKAEDPSIPESVDFDVLREINPDTAAWLYAPDIGLSQVVAYAYDNDYYLDHLLDGSYNKTGTLFVDCRNARYFVDRNTIIYGHSMHNKSMFGQLIDYKDADYCKEHSTMYLYVPGHRFRLDVVAAADTPDASSYYRLPAGYDAWKRLLEEAIEKTAYDFGIPFMPYDHYVMLSTCAYDYSDERWIVICRIDDPERILDEENVSF